MNPPNVLLTKKTPDEQPLAFVYLSQVPYTGFGGGPITEALFWTLLILWSGVLAYFVSVKRIHERLFSLFSLSATATAFVPLQTPTRGTLGGMPIFSPIVRANGEVPEGEGLEIDTPGEEADAGDGEVFAVPSELEKRAYELGVLLSNDAVALLTERGGSLAGAVPLLEKAVPLAREQFPREDGWLHLNRSRLLSLLPGVKRFEELAAPQVVVPSQPSIEAKNPAVFIGWLLDGKSEEVFNFVRALTSQGQSPKTFLASVVSSLGDLHEWRLEGNRQVNEFVREKAKPLSVAHIETILDMLTPAVDESYAASSVGVKVALVRVLEFLRAQKSV